ncbi:proteasome accessory factor A [Actinopolyspora lacussalsi subsp. righensis]|uniref:Proteasome accessory factor A n=1 Tax=Actinopolyspora righensis TaxID=995060 RepID=A0A1I6XHY1_9ACTN|nr:depupylase/deamidase Dop [Actinopolyspora righensis]SFT37642.1 proteasome accessory factor A [Actinopolyspora righensis]
MRRIMGTEVEYGITVPGDATANPVLTSTHIVLAYAAAADIPRARRARWDYEVESPLRDARGFDMGASTAPSNGSEGDDLGAANVILTNGARLYVDHAHPEYSAPEVTNPRDAVLWDKAGERVMEEAALRAASVPGTTPIQLYKNNIDGKGASYGTHENYLCARDTPFTAVIAGLTPFFVSRQIICGSGRVGIGQVGEKPGFQLSQRADYVEVEVGLETTLKRGIINTRDEPHADADKYRRLHVILGDANLAETATYLKLGTTALVLDMIESGRRFDDLRLADPVKAVHQISHDPSLNQKVELADGRHFTGLDLQRAYHERAVEYVEAHGSHTSGEVVRIWGEVLDLLARDPMECADRLDWPAKLKLMENYRSRDNLGWGSPRLHMIDLQYADVRMDKGLYNRLVSRGSMRRILAEEEVREAVTTPPEDTRAYFRGRCLERYPNEVAAASWDSVIFDLGRESLVRIPTLEPLRGTKAHVGELLEAASSAEELVDSLTGG